MVSERWREAEGKKDLKQGTRVVERSKKKEKNVQFLHYYQKGYSPYKQHLK